MLLWLASTRADCLLTFGCSPHQAFLMGSCLTLRGLFSLVPFDCM